MSTNFHWYCFTYAYADPFNSGHCCAYQKFEIQGQFCKNVIEEMKLQANPEGNPNTMVLMNIIYLGYMTQEQFLYVPEETDSGTT